MQVILRWLRRVGADGAFLGLTGVCVLATSYTRWGTTVDRVLLAFAFICMLTAIALSRRT